MSKKGKKESNVTPVSFLLRNATFVCFLALLGLVYIFNAHHSEKKIRHINKLKLEVRDAHDKYMKIKKDVMLESTASELEKALERKGLKNQKRIPTVIGEG